MAPWLVIPVALGLPILVVLYYRRCRSPRARLLALLSHDEYTTEKALAAHRLISETPQLAPALAGCDGRVDMDECALRVLGAAPHDQRQSTNLRHCLGFASELSHLRTALTRQRVAFDGGSSSTVGVCVWSTTCTIRVIAVTSVSAMMMMMMMMMTMIAPVVMVMLLMQLVLLQCRHRTLHRRCLWL